MKRKSQAALFFSQYAQLGLLKSCKDFKSIAKGYNQINLKGDLACFSISNYGDVSKYEDYQFDKGVFEKRVKHQEQLTGLKIVLQRATVVDDVPLTVQGDLPFGIKSRETLGLHTKKSAVVNKSVPLHKKQTRKRKKA